MRSLHKIWGIIPKFKSIWYPSQYLTSSVERLQWQLHSLLWLLLQSKRCLSLSLDLKNEKQFSREKTFKIAFKPPVLSRQISCSAKLPPVPTNHENRHTLIMYAGKFHTSSSLWNSKSAATPSLSCRSCSSLPRPSPLSTPSCSSPPAPFDWRELHLSRDLRC